MSLIALAPFEMACWPKVMCVDPAPTAPDRAPTALPSRVVLKTPSLTFNRHRYFALAGGRIWSKPNEETTGVFAPWELFLGDGLPHPRAHERFTPPESVKALSADADELVALGSNGRFYVKTTRSESWTSDDDWHDLWGFPKRPLLESALSHGVRAWALGRRQHDVLWYEDVDGRQHHYGFTGTSTLYVLSQDGRHIQFTDNGLPSDFSHRLCGPLRGRFVAEGLSASASTLFVIDGFGQMYTKMEDFDLNGGASMLFSYSYRRGKRSSLAGTNPLSSVTSWGLPVPGWRRQPDVELKGSARLSSIITILQNGHGNAARELRVGGTGPGGERGYWSKGIDDERWSFVPVDEVPLRASDFLPGPAELGRPENLPASEDEHLRGTFLLGDSKPVEVELLDFNLDCTPGIMRVHLTRGVLDVTLHLVDAWTVSQRFDPGRDGAPKEFLGTVELPPAGQRPMDDTGDRDILTLLGALDLEPFALHVEALPGRVVIRLNPFAERGVGLKGAAKDIP